MAHDHVHDRGADRRALKLALGLIAALMAGEIVAGILAASLALLSDAAHMLTDAVALAVSLAAAKLAERPARGAMTYGLGRAEVLSAQANGITLLVLAGLIVYGAITRLVSPPATKGAVMLAIAAVMLHSAYRLLKASGRVFMEAAPAGLDPVQIGRVLAAQPGVVEVHDLHVWEVTSGFPALSAHVAVRAGDDCHERRRELQRMLGERFGLRHTTLQVDHEAAEQPPLQIEVAPGGRTDRPRSEAKP